MHVVLLKSRARNRGGLEKAASRIATAFLERGAEVTLLTTGSALEADSYPALQVETIPVNSWPAFLRMEQYDRLVQKWLKKQKPDLIFGLDRNRIQTHIRAGNGVHDAYLKSRILTEGKFKYYTCLLNPMHRKILQLEQESFEYPGLKKLFTNSHMVKEEILKRYKTDPAKIQVIHNGVEWHEMASDFNQWPEIRAQHNSSRFEFLFIGNGYLRKGLRHLLQGLALLKQRDFHLSVIGKDSRQKAFEAEANRLGLQQNVSFFGPRTDIRTFYQIADVLVIPSFYDPFANVTVEALAMGLYVLSSKHNGGSEILTPYNGALIPDLMDPDAMASALQQAMHYKKTPASAALIREEIKHLDYSHQMHLLMEACYE